MGNQTEPPIVGIVNMGNTCYMNAVLQCLMSDRCLIDMIDRRLKICEPSSRTLSEGLLVMFYSRRSPAVDFLRPRIIAQIFAEQHPSFKIGLEQDAHEFLTLFMDQLEKDFSEQRMERRRLNELELRRASNRCKDSKESRVAFRLKPSKVLVKSFKSNIASRMHLSKSSRENASRSVDSSLGYYLSLQRQFICVSCGCRSQPRIERQLGLSVSIPEGPRTPSDEASREIWNLDDFVWDCFLPELIERKCEYCCSSYSVTETRVSKAPRCLVVHLKRFSADGRKIDTSVEIPQTISVEPALQASPGEPVNFQLFAIVRHRSISCESGHYTADVLVDDASWTWTHCDDLRIFPRYPDVLQEEQGYLCFYKVRASNL